MSADKRAENTAQNIKGHVEEAWGKVTGDTETELRGKADQAAADLKNRKEDVKDAFEERRDDDERNI